MMILLCLDFIIFITFIDYMFAGKSVLDYTNLFFPKAYKNNSKIIYIKYFKDKYSKRKRNP